MSEMFCTTHPVRGYKPEDCPDCLRAELDKYKQLYADSLDRVTDREDECDGLNARIDGLLIQLGEALKSIEFSKEWYGTKWKRLADYTRAHVTDEKLSHDIFSILANGQPSVGGDHYDPNEPSNWRDLNLMKFRAEAAEKELAKAKVDLAEMQATFDLRWNADRRAIERWRAEQPAERELRSPDHADMVVWLMQQFDGLMNDVKRAEEAFEKADVELQTLRRERKKLLEDHPYRADVMFKTLNEQVARDAVQIAKLESSLARHRWRPIDEIHEDLGPCILVNIADCGEMAIGSNLDLDFDITQWTHFAELPVLGQAEYERMRKDIIKEDECSNT